MGCSKCKQSKKNKIVDINFKQVKGDVTVDKDGLKLNNNGNTVEMLKQFKPDGFFIRIITFIALLVAIPLICVYLIFFLFYNFFIPNTNNMGLSLSNVINFIVKPVKKWKNFRKKIKSKSKEREFKDNRGYDDGSELLDIEVYEPEERKQKRTYEGEEELKDIEILEIPKEEDNDKD